MRRPCLAFRCMKIVAGRAQAGGDGGLVTRAVASAGSVVPSLNQDCVQQLIFRLATCRRSLLQTAELLPTHESLARKRRGNPLKTCCPADTSDF